MPNRDLSKFFTIFEYSAPNSLVDTSQENVVILKCVSHQSGLYDIENMVVDGSITLLALPGLPSSGYAIEIILQQWEVERFDLVCFMAQIGCGIVCILCVILLLVTIVLIHHREDVAADVNDFRGFFILVILTAKKTLRYYVCSVFPLPILFQLLDIKRDRDMYLTRMEKNIEYFEQENHKDESRRRNAEELVRL